MWPLAILVSQMSKFVERACLGKVNSDVCVGERDFKAYTKTSVSQGISGINQFHLSIFIIPTTYNALKYVLR
jgi:hypothetical protein